MRITSPLAILACAIALVAAPAAATAQVLDDVDDVHPAFRGHGMWIWQVPRAAGGDPAGIAARARAFGVDTLIIKAAHGRTPWSQFSPELVSALKAEGFTVCGYQRLESTHAAAQARAGATAKAAGADCFVIDAEAELEGRYAQARTYVRTLRRLIGDDFPLGFTSFPYVDLHPLMPYSVFLGEGAATVNMPQIYWKDIGHSPSAAIARTVATNLVYRRPLAPIGQLYQRPTAKEITDFRRIALAYGVAGLSWWSWDSAVTSGWRAIARAVTPTALRASPPTYPTVRPGARSDYVVWAKDHLRERGYRVTRDTRFDATTAAAVRAFQSASGLPVTGVLDPATWAALLEG
ncbi:MAG: peptidoglycan-binding protein [Solirubrobacteraceae bacterium]|nr:peptidoglycan-binding protein [Solirubrobacteraceae bacterium]